MTMRSHIFISTLFISSVLCATTVAIAQTPPAATTTSTTITAATTAASNVGQTITVDNHAFVVSARKQLATGVEFYSLKATTPKAIGVNYLRTRNTYNPTVFTQAQYEAFVRTGKVSSFGKLQTKTVWYAQMELRGQGHHQPVVQQEGR